LSKAALKKLKAARIRKKNKKLKKRFFGKRTRK